MPSSDRVVLVGAVAVVAVIVAYSAFVLTSVPGSVTSGVPTSFTVNGKTYAFTYVATTEAERVAGLMNRQITNTTTMLFAFPSLVSQPFWMYQTNTSLDMIWVNASGDAGVVVYVQSDAAPCPSLPCQTYPATGQAPLANYVIEAKAGFAAANGIRAGTPVQFA